jgi:hypothetical protein
MRGDFEASLLNYIAPRLQPLGYAYDTRLRLDEELFGFRKSLDNDVQAMIQFQRQDDPVIDRFTVNLIRVQASEVQPRLYGDEASARAARLNYVLWFVYGLGEYPVSDFWWTASDASQREAVLNDVAEKIVRYGVPWLENLDASKPWEMPVRRADEFSEAVQAVMGSEMERRGFRLEQQSLPGNVAYCYFSKAMPDRTYALIELQAIYSLDPSEFNFDVRLQRRADRDPLAFNGDYRHWRSISLAQLVWRTRGGTPLEQLSISEVKTLFWHYRDRAELDAQLSEALEQIKQIGCAWLEQAGDRVKDDTRV